MTVGGFEHGLGFFAVLAAAGFLVTEPWRWLGIVLARDLSADSEIFRWTRAVSTAIVAALVARMLVFPTGALDQLPVWLRLAAFITGLLAFFGTGRRLGRGVAAALFIITAGGLALSL